MKLLWNFWVDCWNWYWLIDIRIVVKDVIWSETPLSASYFNTFLVVVILEKKTCKDLCWARTFVTVWRRSHRMCTIRWTHRGTLRPATLLKKRLWHRCFPVDFCKFFRNIFSTEHLRFSASAYELYHKYFVFPRTFFLLVTLSNSILTTYIVPKLLAF